MNEDLVAIARIAKPRGLRGECVADILTDFPERFAETIEVIAALPNGARRDLKIEDARFQKGRVNLKFVGVNDTDAAEELRGATICVPESETFELEEGEFFDWELAGCRVESIDGTPIGTVREIMRTGGTEILVVAGESKEYLIPFAETICTEVDVENKLIRVDAPEGLLEF
ncbi:MAG: 16S rRNA processing protein RimM [Acidobacteria bacterium]|nr:16S rRNA processing protein RimM [Acidobacteriota bacterium]